MWPPENNARHATKEEALLITTGWSVACPLLQPACAAGIAHNAATIQSEAHTLCLCVVGVPPSHFAWLYRHSPPLPPPCRTCESAAAADSCALVLHARAGGSSLQNLHAMVEGVSHDDAPVAVDGDAATRAVELCVA